ncbi:MAG: DUF3794 domain-containing protein [Clostridia bacterium]|nr:DUF3794 domain-containing protein [Clostridia bacterium]
MINDRENGYFTVGLHERTFGVEAAGDYTLPDYQSEIRRVLHVSQTVLPPAVYVGADSVEFSGTVDYQLIYVGGDGGIYSAPLSGEYSFNAPLERGMDVTEDMRVLCHVCAEGVSTRVSAPRRLSIRSRLRPNVRILGKLPTSDGVTEQTESDTLYRKTERCMSVECESAVSELIPLTYSTPLASDDMRVVCADAKVCVTEKECVSGGVRCRGRAELCMLWTTEDSGEMNRITADIPFEGEIDADGCTSESMARVHGTLSEMAVSVGEDGVECNMGIMLEAVICRNDETEYTSDLYSTENECVCETAAVSPRRMLVCANANVTLGERVPLSETTVPEGAEIIDAHGSVVMDKCTHTDGRYTFGGNGRFAVIWRNDGDINSSEVTLPVRLEVQGSESGEPVSFDARAEATDVRARIEDGSLRIDSELMMSVDCMGETVVRTVTGVSFGEEIPPRGSELIVCYPTPDDTLWSVAKRYKVAPADIIGDPGTDRYVMI